MGKGCGVRVCMGATMTGVLSAAKEQVKERARRVGVGTRGYGCGRARIGGTMPTIRARGGGRDE